MLDHISFQASRISELESNVEAYLEGSAEWEDTAKKRRNSAQSLYAENEKQAARIAELEAGLDKAIKGIMFVFDGMEKDEDCTHSEDLRKVLQKLLSPKDTQGEG
jgi:hypothetical protein